MEKKKKDLLTRTRWEHLRLFPSKMKLLAYLCVSRVISGMWRCTLILIGKLLLTACSHIITVFKKSEIHSSGLTVSVTLIRMHYVMVDPVNWLWGHECRIQMATVTFFSSPFWFSFCHKNILHSLIMKEERKKCFFFFSVFVLIPSQTEPRSSLRDVAARWVFTGKRFCFWWETGKSGIVTAL